MAGSGQAHGPPRYGLRVRVRRNRFHRRRRVAASVSPSSAPFAIQRHTTRARAPTAVTVRSVRDRDDRIVCLYRLSKRRSSIFIHFYGTNDTRRAVTRRSPDGKKIDRNRYRNFSNVLFFLLFCENSCEKYEVFGGDGYAHDETLKETVVDLQGRIPDAAPSYRIFVSSFVKGPTNRCLARRS